MNILHICNDYCGSKVHANLYSELDKQGVQQTVYVYYRDRSLEGKNRFEARSTAFVYRPILSTHHRLLYHKKVRDVYADLKSQLSKVIPSYDLIHATTLFSDGAVARRIFKEDGTPYIVTVRNTDINEFLGYAPHTWFTGLQVLKDAHKIIFISKALKEKFCRHPLVRTILKKIEDRFVIQPNGIDAYWLEHIKTVPALENHNVIYVGRFDYNKNVTRLIQAVLRLKSEVNDISLHLVGGDGCMDGMVKFLVNNHNDTLFYHGKIFEKDRLCEIYRNSSVFAMPSIHETFGLVYIEALSQGLPVLYTKNQGIDGLFSSSIGEAVNALSTKSIEDGLRKILLNQTYYKRNNKIDFEKFRWSKIAVRYKNLYDLCLEEPIDKGL